MGGARHHCIDHHWFESEPGVNRTGSPGRYLIIHHLTHCVALAAGAAARSPRASVVLEGAMVELARDGAREQATLVREAISEADLNEALRTAGLTRLADAQLIA